MVGKVAQLPDAQFQASEQASAKDIQLAKGIFDVCLTPTVLRALRDQFRDKTRSKLVQSGAPTTYTRCIVNKVNAISLARLRAAALGAIQRPGSGYQRGKLLVAGSFRECQASRGSP